MMQLMTVNNFNHFTEAKEFFKNKFESYKKIIFRYF